MAIALSQQRLWRGVQCSGSIEQTSSWNAIRVSQTETNSPACKCAKCQRPAKQAQPQRTDKPCAHRAPTTKTYHSLHIHLQTNRHTAQRRRGQGRISLAAAVAKALRRRRQLRVRAPIPSSYRRPLPRPHRVTQRCPRRRLPRANSLPHRRRLRRRPRCRRCPPRRGQWASENARVSLNATATETRHDPPIARDDRRRRRCPHGPRPRTHCRRTVEQQQRVERISLNMRDRGSTFKVGRFAMRLLQRRQRSDNTNASSNESMHTLCAEDSKSPA